MGTNPPPVEPINQSQSAHPQQSVTALKKNILTVCCRQSSQCPEFKSPTRDADIALFASAIVQRIHS